MYYTDEHEWIDYRGYTANVGICKVKLSGIDRIQSAAFCDTLTDINCGAVIVTFFSEQHLVEVRMPVDGKIISFNNELIQNPSLILNRELSTMWIARISPNAPYKREKLLQEYQYNSYKKRG